jgi:hypothetical protein
MLCFLFVNLLLSPIVCSLCHCLALISNDVLPSLLLLLTIDTAVHNVLQNQLLEYCDNVML